MKKLTEEEIKIFNYMTDTLYDASVVAEKFKVSISKIKHLPGKVRELDIDRYFVYENRMKSKIKKIKSQAGSISKRESNISKEEITSLTNDIVKNDYTLTEAEKKLKIPKSTIYEYINKVEDKELLYKVKSMFELHKGKKRKNG